MAKKYKKDKQQNPLTAQISWKYLPLVILLIFLFSLPGILARQNIRQQGREMVEQSQVTATEYKREIADDIVANSPALTRSDAECVADVIVDTHGVSKLETILETGGTPYTDEVQAEMLSRCEVEL